METVNYGRNKFYDADTWTHKGMLKVSNLIFNKENMKNASVTTKMRLLWMHGVAIIILRYIIKGTLNTINLLFMISKFESVDGNSHIICIDFILFNL